MAVWRVATPQQLGAALSGARHEAGMTQDELAAWVKVNRRYLTVLEQGQASLQTQRLLDALNVLGYEMIIAPKGHPIGPAR